MKNVNYKSLRRFEIGHAPINPGYQTNKNVVSTNAFGSNAGYDMRGDTQAVKNSILPSALAGLGSVGNTAMNFAQNYTSLASAASTNVSNAISKGLVDTAGNFTAKGAELAVKNGIQGAAEGAAAGASGTEAVLKASGSAVEKAGLNAIGKAVSIAGIASGLYDTGRAIASFSDRLRGDDMENMTATSTATKNGIAYKSYDGFDESQIRQYTSAQNAQGKLNAALGGFQTGFSAGSLSGNPIIAAAAGVGGGLLGLLGGVIGSNSRKEKVEQDIFATKGLHYGANTQNESVAGSKGKRIQFYSGGADKGKRPGESLSGGKYGVIQTPSGPAYGEIQGLASPDEGMINVATGETKYLGSKSFGVKDKHADIVPVGVKGFADNGAFDQYVSILGHTPLNPLDPDGPTHADAARPLFKQNDQFKDMFAEIDAELEQNENHKTRDKATKQFMENKMKQKQKLIQQAYNQNTQDLMALVNNQTAMTTGAYFNCGKTPRYEDGKSGNDDININPFRTSYAGLSPIYGALQSLPYAISDTLAANKHTPYAQNSYVANPTAQQALNVLGSLRYDPTRQLDQVTSATRQSQYNINNAGSLSAGQRAALASSGLIQAAQARNAIYDKAGEVNNGYRTAYANALMGYGQDEATRLQQANAYQQEAYRQAVGAKQKLQAQARKNWYTLGRQNLQDFNTWLNTQGMLNLWDKQVAADEAKAGIKKPTTNVATENGAQKATPELIESSLDKFMAEGNGGRGWWMPNNAGITDGIPSATEVAGNPVEKLNIADRMNAQLAKDYKNYKANTDWMEIDPYRLTGKQLKAFQKDIKNRDKLMKKNPQSLSARAMQYARRKKGGNKYAVANAYMRNVLLNRGYGSDADQIYLNYD